MVSCFEKENDLTFIFNILKQLKLSTLVHYGFIAFFRDIA